MYRIDKFLEYYNNLNGTNVEIEKGIWANAKPIPFYYGIFTKKYWKIFRSRLVDAWFVFRGKAEAITWEK